MKPCASHDRTVPYNYVDASKPRSAPRDRHRRDGCRGSLPRSRARHNNNNNHNNNNHNDHHRHNHDGSKRTPVSDQPVRSNDGAPGNL